MIKKRKVGQPTGNAVKPVIHKYLVSYYDAFFKHPANSIVKWDKITAANIKKFENDKRGNSDYAVYVVSVVKLEE